MTRIALAVALVANAFVVQVQEGPSSTGADLHDGGDPLTDPEYRSSLMKDALAPWFGFKDG